MNNIRLVYLLIFVVIYNVVNTAQATIIEDNLADNLYLSNGNVASSDNTSGSFDLTDQAYDYARVTFSFVDDTYFFGDEQPVDWGESDSTLGGTPIIHNGYIGSSWFFDGYEVMTTPLQDIIETAQISIANIIGTVSASYMSDHSVKLHEHDEYGHQWDNIQTGCMPDCDSYKLTHYAEYSGYTGYFTFETLLLKSQIESVLVDGKLPFDIGAQSGDFDLAAASIETFMFSAQRSAADIEALVASVPEPATISLFLFALLGLSCGRGKRGDTRFTFLKRKLTH